MILKYSVRNLLWIVVIFSRLISYGQPDRSEIIIGSKDSLYSKVLGENRPIWVYVPHHYNNEHSAQRQYPVLYLLDGTANFHSITGIVQALSSGINSTYDLPQMIVVALPNTDRTRDLTPTHSIKSRLGDTGFLKNSGGGTEFLKFMKTELIPHIDSSYRTLPYRIFVGHSFGGITVINALHTMPETFNAYVAIDPSLWWDNKVLVKKAKDFFLTNDLNGKSLFLAQANTLHPFDTINEHFESIKEFVAILKTRNTSGLRWEYKYYEDEDHASVSFIAAYDALRFLFKDYAVRYNQIISADQLKRQYQRLAQQTQVNFSPSEPAINVLASLASFYRQPDLELQYYQLGLEYYPDSADLHNSIGDVWKKKGNPKKALEYYQRSLLLDPHNEQTKRNIKNINDTLKIKK